MELAKSKLELTDENLKAVATKIQDKLNEKFSNILIDAKSYDQIVLFCKDELYSYFGDEYSKIYYNIDTYYHTDINKLAFYMHYVRLDTSTSGYTFKTDVNSIGNAQQKFEYLEAEIKKLKADYNRLLAKVDELSRNKTKED